MRTLQNFRTLEMDLQLRDKVVIITGASRGIGLAAARAFALEHARVVLVARDKAKLEAARRQIEAMDRQTYVVAADLMESDAAGTVVDAALAAFGRVDIVVANAGGSFGGGLADSVREEWEKTYQLNVLHAVELLRAAVPAMAKNGGGAAVFISSISARAPVKRRAQYAAAKPALTHTARSLAQELAPLNVRVNAVSPGSVLFEGGGWDQRRRSKPEEYRAFVDQEHPFRRLGTPEEIARVVTFVASPAAFWINGADLPVDGGQGRPSID